MNYDSDDVMRCLEVFSDNEQPYNVSFPNSASDFTFETRMYWIQGHQGLEAEITEDIGEICIKGQDPVILLRSYVLNVIKLEIYFLATKSCTSDEVYLSRKRHVGGFY